MSSKITGQIAKHVEQVYFGGNWTTSNLKGQLADVTWQEATTEIKGLNTIATLVNHMTYYTRPVSRVLEGEPLVAKDADSFTHPSINSQEDWERIQNQHWVDAEQFVALIKELPDEKLLESFTEEKYGIYFRNLMGVVEHFHYHLGQVSLLKKLIKQRT